MEDVFGKTRRLWIFRSHLATVVFLQFWRYHSLKLSQMSDVKRTQNPHKQMKRCSNCDTHIQYFCVHLPRVHTHTTSSLFHPCGSQPWTSSHVFFPWSAGAVPIWHPAAHRQGLRFHGRFLMQRSVTQTNTNYVDGLHVFDVYLSSINTY